MHIPEGVLSAPVLATGAIVAGAGVAVGLRVLSDKDMVKVSVLSSAFFVASLIHVPAGATSVHLVLAGLTGLLLGWAVFPAVAVALLLQAALFGMGGFTTLGVNTLIMAVPGIVCYLMFARLLTRTSGSNPFWIGFAAGGIAILLAAVFQAFALVLSGSEFKLVAVAVIAAHVPIMIIEGLVTGWAVVFLQKVRPETFHLFDAPALESDLPALDSATLAAEQSGQ